MKSIIETGFIWKVVFIFLALLTLYVEISSYTNTTVSIGELILYQWREYTLVLSCTITMVFGGGLILSKRKLQSFVLVVLICILVFLFYPIMDMQGVDHAF